MFTSILKFRKYARVKLSDEGKQKLQPRREMHGTVIKVSALITVREDNGGGEHEYHPDFLELDR